MKTYIFSNCKKNDFKTYGRNLLAKVPKDARLIILNQGNVYYHVPEFDQYPNQNFIMRCGSTHGLECYFGSYALIGSRRNKMVSDVIWFRPATSTARILIGHKNNQVDQLTLEIPWMEEYHKKTNGNFATTGYSAYYLVQDIYKVNPDDIYLVNFYGNSDSSTTKDPEHNWNYEDQWLKDKQRIYC